MSMTPTLDSSVKTDAEMETAVASVKPPKMAHNQGLSEAESQ